jgi:hypothetical protein
MGLRKSPQMTVFASLSSPHFDANPFLPKAAMCAVLRPFAATTARGDDGAETAVMGLCRAFESSLPDDPALERDFDDGPQRRL